MTQTEGTTQLTFEKYRDKVTIEFEDEVGNFTKNDFFDLVRTHARTIAR